MEDVLIKRPAEFVSAVYPGSLREHCSEDEWETRCELAALFRLTHHYGLDDMANGIAAARIKDQPGHYLIHPYGIFWDEVRASDFVVINDEGDIVPRGDRVEDRYVGVGVINVVLWVFNNKPTTSFVMHGHVEEIQAVSVTRDGLQPLSQAAIYLSPMIDYINYDFLEDEVYAKSFVEQFLDHEILISRHHGYYTAGASAGEALFRTFYLAHACRVQIQSLSQGQPVILLDDDRLNATHEEMYASDEYNYDGATEWLGWMRLLERKNPGWME